MKDFRSVLKGACSAAVILACGVVAPLSPAAAQDASQSARLERIERDLMVLQRQIYRSKVTGGDVAAPSVGAGGAVAQLGELEEQIRDLTGQIETLSFQIQQNKDHMERMQKDIDFRLRALEGNPLQPAEGAQVAPSTTPPATLTPAQPGTGAIPAKPATGPVALTPPKGTVSATTPELQIPDAQSAKSPRDLYGAAFKLVQKGDYAGAEVGFKDFLAKHKDDALAGNATYWLGETYYVRGHYEKAAVTFADGYKTYRSSPKAADNLFKLGRSMQKLKKTPNACAAFGQLLKEFPKANKVTLQLAKSQRAELKCP